jgi:hypothetical protein
MKRGDAARSPPIHFDAHIITTLATTFLQQLTVTKLGMKARNHPDFHRIFQGSFPPTPTHIVSSLTVIQQ